MGLVGCVAGQLCRRAILTDRDPVTLETLRLNVARNCPGKDVAVAELSWGDEAHLADLPLGQVDLILGSDVIYPSIGRSVIASLFRSARRLLRPGPGSQVILSFISRDGKPALRNLFEASLEEGIVLREVVDAGAPGMSHPNPIAATMGARILIFGLLEGPQTGSLGGGCEVVASKQREVVGGFFPGVWEEDPVREGQEEEEEEVWEPPFCGSDEEAEPPPSSQTSG